VSDHKLLNSCITIALHELLWDLLLNIMKAQKVTSTNIVAYFVPLSVTKHSHCNKDGKMTQ